MATARWGLHVELYNIYIHGNIGEAILGASYSVGSFNKFSKLKSMELTSFKNAR